MTDVVRWAYPPELVQLPRDRHAVVEASAGTGKTYLLEHRIVDLLLHGDAELEHILVVTFTEKATAELRARVRSRLVQMRDARADGPASALPGAPMWTLGPAERASLSRALASFDAAPIDTIHAFCQRVLVDNAFASGRLFAQDQVDRETAFASAFTEALREELSCSEEHRPLLAAWLRGGRGIAELERLLRRCAQTSATLGPVWSPARLRDALAGAPAALPVDVEGRLGSELRAAKVHANTARAAARRGAQVLEAAAAYRADGDLAAFLAEIDLVQREDDDSLVYLRDKLAGKALPGLAGELRDLVERVLPAVVPLAAAVAQGFLPAVEARLRARKLREGQFDFQDMLELVWEALEGPRGEELARDLRSRYRFALIDEFQDTDQLQWRIFHRLFAAPGVRTRLFVIGDPKQAIYGFRGADVHTYLTARDELRAGGAASLALVHNYRSSAPLCAAFNELLGEQLLTSFFTGDIRYTNPVESATDRVLRDDDGPPVRLFEVTPAPGGTLSAASLRAALAGRIADEIRALLAAPPVLAARGAERPIGAADIYVLTRTTAEAIEMARTLRGAGVDCALYKPDGLFNTVEAHHIRDLLAGIARPDGRSERAKAWRTPFFAVPHAALYDLGDLPDSHPLLGRLLDWKDLADRLAYEELFARILSDSGVLRRELLLGDSERALTNYLHLFELLLEEVSAARCDLPELLARLGGFIAGTRTPAGEQADVQRLETERDAVQILTMHKSKGLERPIVFLFCGAVGMPADEVRVYHQDGERRAHVGRCIRDGVVQAAADREASEEDQRLLYVAITRAQVRLYLPYVAPASYGLRGSYQPLNTRLGSVVARLGEPAVAALFAREVVPARPRAALAAAAAIAAGAVPWAPPAALLDDDDRSAERAALRAARRGFTVTSYTRLKRAGERAGERAPGPRPADDGLPAGAATGIFLHEALERVALDGLAGAPPPLAEWRARPGVDGLLRTLIARHGLEPRHLEPSAALVDRALTAPLPLGARTVPSVAAGRRHLREVEFLYPIPEAAHPPLGAAPGPAGFRIERGFVRGVIDLLFEHDGRVYLVHWKSDSLADYGPVALAEHVAGNYGLQIELYALALARLLELRDQADTEARLGGVALGFLRGFAVHAVVPTWADLGRWHAALQAREDLS